MRPLGAATLSLLDDGGMRLADVEFDARGTMGIRQGQVADCPPSDSQASVSAAARSAWQACIRRQSAWTMTWAERVRAADLRFGACDIRRIPVVLAKSGDAWWLWRAPLPHVGGDPYTVIAILPGLSLFRAWAGHRLQDNGVRKITGAKLSAASGWIESPAFDVEIRSPAASRPRKGWTSSFSTTGHASSPRWCAITNAIRCTSNVPFDACGKFQSWRPTSLPAEPIALAEKPDYCAPTGKADCRHYDFPGDRAPNFKAIQSNGHGTVSVLARSSAFRDDQAVRVQSIDYGKTWTFAVEQR